MVFTAPKCYRIPHKTIKLLKMADFDDLRKQLKVIKSDRQQSEQSAFLAREKLKRLDRQKKNLLRTESDNDDRLQEIILEERSLRSQISEHESTIRAQIEAESEVFVNFQPFTDPRSHISRFSDEYPLLLLPLRIETRFKKIPSATGPKHQLWVRVFPDECSIDTFENTVTEAEIKKAKDYWLSIWNTGSSAEEELEGFISAGKKAAWRNLAGNFQPGRAYWITEQYIPLNISELPVRNAESDVILCIGTEDLPSVPDIDALKLFWKSVWLAGSNDSDYRLALDDFVTSIGDEERAMSLIELYRPFNLADVTAPQENPPEVEVHFLQFPNASEINPRISSWSQAAKITTFPEKLVLMGFKGTDRSGDPIQVVSKLGNSIPDPLIMGPNPSIDIDAVLKSELVEDYNSQTDDTKKEEKLRTYYDQLKEERKAELSEEEYVADFLRLPEAEVPVALERIFDNLRDEVKAALYISYLSERSETKWLFDFEEAIDKGMGFKVDLTPEIYNQGFDRLFVLGVKLAKDENTSQEALEELLEHHHFGSSGFSILPQGSPTNNTEEETSVFSEQEDSDTSYERYFSEAVPESTSSPLEKKDGQWLAELLGIDPSMATLHLVDNYYHTDQCEAQAMNVALWNCTIGYFMESLLTPVFTDEQQRVVRSFFIDNISGRGKIPAIRIADQPYGILPTSKVKNAQWLRQDGDENILFTSKYGNTASVLIELYDLIGKVYADFEPLLADVAYVGKEGDPHQLLLDVLGLHATSVEFHQRYAESFAQVFNQLNMSGLGRIISALIEAGYKKRGLDLLKELGYSPTEKDDPVPILEKFFLTKANPLKGDLIDDQPLSERDPIRTYTEADGTHPDGMNYVEWLIENATTDFDAIKRNSGFQDKAPTALLFQMLRHALMIEFSNTSLGLYQDADIMDASSVRKTKVDEEFIGIRVGENAFESKFEYLERIEPRITTTGASVAEHIVSQLDLGNRMGNFNEMLQALEHLQKVPTARLERAFVEHLDCCTYRLDAWMLGFVNLQLGLMRQNTDSNLPSTKKGLYMGAYGWVEDLTPDNAELAPVQLAAELAEVFNPDGDLHIVSDSSNAGYVHAPSVNQAITAAVLRNAYISEATAEDPEIYKVNLSSERVRMALSMIQGIQQGQSLGALLGYQLERGLHDRYEEAEVDVFIYELRKHFSLRANQISETSESEEDLDSISQIEARNVVDGLKLVKHVNETGNTTYPFGLSMRFATESEFADHRRIVNEEVNRLRNINDAVADLATAESVHQVVQANYDRAAGTMDAYSKGGFPPTPEIVRTPRSGVSLTNRVGIHLKAGITITDPENIRARIVGEPAVNDWLLEILPDLEDICCRVLFGLPTYNDDPVSFAEEVISAQQLELSPIDLLYMLNVDADKSLNALDEYILRFVHETHTPRPDVEIKINYTDLVGGKITFFELMPLIRSLRALILESRPLKPSDMMLSGEASNIADLGCEFRIERLENTMEKFKNPFKDTADLDQGLTLLDNPFLMHFDPKDFEQTMLQKTVIINEIDDFITAFLDLLRHFSQFGIAQSGFGAIFQRKGTIYSIIYQKILDYRDRWLNKIDNYDRLINNEFVAPGLSDSQKMEILQKAERQIATTYILSAPAAPDNPAAFLSELVLKKEAFDLKFNEITAWLGANFRSFKDLVENLITLKTGVDSTTGTPLAQFDLLLPETEEYERQIVVFGEDLVSQLVQLNETLKKKGKKSDELLIEFGTQAAPNKKTSLATEAMQQLLGEEFKIIPEFTLNAQHGTELRNAFNERDRILDHQRDEMEVDFPMDDWLYGTARVREKIGALESLMILSEGFKDISLELNPLQLPFINNDIWLGLSYPDTYDIESDKLLYTAMLSSFDETQVQCGLLVDEWTEVIPTETETTALSFQYDQPNAEPPQSMLLVTPASFKGSWDWSEVVDALHDTLDLVKLRAIEPKQIDNTPYAQFLPATVTAVTSIPFVTIAMNYAVNNGLILNFDEDA